MEKNWPSISLRKLIDFGESYGVTIPKDWVKAKELKKGDKLVVITNDRLTISTSDDKEFKEKLHKKVEVE